MNTFTQQQMTTGRNAFGLSLLAGKVLASLSTSPKAQTPSNRKQQAAGKHAAGRPYANDAQQPCAGRAVANFHKQDGERRHRREHAPHIRGGNP